MRSLPERLAAQAKRNAEAVARDIGGEVVEYGKLEVYDVKHYTVGFTVKVEPQDLTYGRVTRNGKTYWRNYHRPLKNGRGFSLLDIMTLNAEATRRKMVEQMALNVFHRGSDK